MFRPERTAREDVDKFLTKVGEKATQISIGGISVGDVLDKTVTKIPEVNIFQKSTLTDDGTGGQTSPTIESTQFTVGNYLSTPVEIASGLGETAEKGVNLLASGIEKYQQEI